MKRRSTAARAPTPAVARRAPAEPTGGPGPGPGQHERLLGLNQALGNQAMGALLSGGGPGLGVARDLSLFPEIPAPKLVRAGRVVSLTVYFGKDHFLLVERNLRAVESLAEELKSSYLSTITVDGHASGEGEPPYNQALSEQRRDLVVALLGKDLDPKPTFAGSAHGEQQPAVAETGSDEALEEVRAQNRRVEIVVTPKMFSPVPLPEKTGGSPLLVPQEKSKLFPKTPEQALADRVREGYFNLGSQGRSLEDRADEKLDEMIDNLLLEVGVKNAKRRGWFRRQLRNAVKSGLKKGIDAVIESGGFEPQVEDAIKKGVEGLMKVKY